jgi:demethylmenaquinone methyltransferase / 2-methoxy-6-polyprenyl-1,4-benzoquinol methylase
VTGTGGPSSNGSGPAPTIPPSTVGISLETAARAREADLPTGEAKTELVRDMFDAIAPRYDLVNRTMTFGLDIRWRKQSLRALGLAKGSTVLDLACGTGDFLKLLRAGDYRAFGLDLSWGMLTANHAGSPLAQADGAALPVADLGAVFREFGRVVRPGGRISLLEVSEPESGLLLTGHRIWFRTMVPVIGGLLSDRSAYRYLPKSTAYLPSTEEMRAMLLEAGFSAVNRRGLTGGLSQLITATRSGRP